MVSIDNLNNEQKEAVLATSGPVRILAGAGSGKTHTLAHRTARIIEEGSDPEKILLLTFTNKAASEIKSRVISMLGDKAEGMFAGTYHSFCVNILRRYARFTDKTPNFMILSGADMIDAVSLAKANCDHAGIESLPKSGRIAGVISAAKNTQTDLYEYLMYLGETERIWSDAKTQILDIAAEYERYKKEKGYLDYDDILTETLDLFTKRPDIAEIVEAKYTHIMIDEYQDSNRLQDAIIDAIRVNNKNLCVVGDDMQSLYAFRGARVENIIEFDKTHPGCRTIKLTKNYRSVQPVLDLANASVRENATEGIYKEMTGIKDGPKPILIETMDSAEEAVCVCEIIENARKLVPEKEIAVLVRNARHSYMLESVLLAKGIPFQKFGGRKFIEKKAVADVLAYMRILTNTLDELAWFRVLRLYEGIARTFAQKLSEMAKEKGRDLLVDHPFQKRKFANDLIVLKKQLEEWDKEEFRSLAKTISDAYIRQQKEIVKNSRSSDKKKIEMLESLDEAEKDLEVLSEMTSGYASAKKFLDDILTDPSKDAEKDQMITISTIHSAKGLEWHTVVVMENADEIFPKTTIFDAGTKEDNEELRCFYVAVTRAKERLYLTSPSYIQIKGIRIPASPSHFIDKNYVEKQSPGQIEEYFQT